MERAKRATDFRRVLYELLEQGPVGERRTRLRQPADHPADRGQSGHRRRSKRFPHLEAQYGGWFAAIEWISLVVFSVEYLARLWCAAEHAPDRHLQAGARAAQVHAQPGGPRRSRSRCCRSGSGSSCPLDLRFLLVFRIVRFLKLARYSPGDALADRGALCRAARAVRLRRDPDRHDAGRRVR